MAKLAILTLPLSDNYGGVLQAYALYSHLSEMGHEVTLLRKQLNIRRLSAMTRVGRYLLETVPVQNRKGYRHRALRRRSHADFISRQVKRQSLTLDTSTQIAEYATRKGIDAIIVGSDQVWRMAYIGNGPYDAFFLNFPKKPGFRKIAYAASFGVDTWEAPELAPEIAKMLSDFDAVSLRETSGMAICTETLGLENCEVALDPTLLVDPALFHALGRKPRDVLNTTFLTYVLDEAKSCTITVERLRQHFGKGHSAHKAINGPQAYSIEEWLGLFQAADFVVTDSFHGMIFSIIFQRQFVGIGNHARGMARFESLADLLGLSHRLIRPGEDAIGETLQPVDYSQVWPRLQALREASHTFLKDALPEP